MMIIPGSAEYWQLFDGFQRSAYRPETLQHYQADTEAWPLRAFLPATVISLFTRPRTTPPIPSPCLVPR